ncbi:MAG: DnaA regulatory inactivator Hda [Gammaproteobacteria bacterium]|nr:DnaA regulatory inactivator Hda [Gammaproteobacteria bacterium]
MALQLNERFSFDNFCSLGNEEVLRLLRGSEAASAPRAAVAIYLWGGQGVGKTHLLQAACRARMQVGRTAFVSFSEGRDDDPSRLEGLGEFDLVCLDEMEHCPSDDAWQIALLDLYHRVEEGAGRLVLAGRVPISQLGGKPDWRSRLAAGISMRVRALSDAGRAEAMEGRAAERGISLPPEVSTYILHRAPRDMHALMGFIDLLDRRSLADRRKLTVPYVRELLAEIDDR